MWAGCMLEWGGVAWVSPSWVSASLGVLCGLGVCWKEVVSQLAQKHYQNIIKMFGQTLWKCFGKMLKSYENVWFWNDQENIFITLDNNINKTFKTHFFYIKLWCYNNIILMLSRMLIKHINNIFTMFESYVI